MATKIAGIVREDNMRQVHSSATVILFALGLFLLVATGMIAECQAPKTDAKPTLGDAFRKWDKGFASEKKEERLKTLRSMFPTRKELGHLFPDHVDKLWPKFEEGHKFLEENVESIATEITNGGAITKITPIDARADKDLASGAFKELLAILPKDVQVFQMSVSRETRSSTGGTFLFIKDRWFWIKDLETFPKILDKLK